MSNILWVILGILGLIALWLIMLYNSLITLKNRVDEAWSDIDVQLKRRYDLIPNLVEAVRSYAKHESTVFEKVSEARSAAMGAKSMEDHTKAENTLTGALKTLFAVSEAYPQLRASENFVGLQDELSDTENKIQASRRFYNGNVRDFDIRIQKFPNNLLANSLGFKKRNFFEIGSEEERAVPKVKL